MEVVGIVQLAAVLLVALVGLAALSNRMSLPPPLVLVPAGVILGWLSCIAGIVDLVGRRYTTAPVAPWIYAVGIFVVMVLATFNMLIHTCDAWTSVVPWGLTLSAITVIVLIFTTIVGWMALYRRRAVVDRRRWRQVFLLARP